MQARLGVVGLVTGLGLSVMSTGAGAAQSVQVPALPFPTTGNVTVARVAIQGTSGVMPKLTLASRSIPAGSFVAASVARDSRVAGRYMATVAIIYAGVGSPPTPRPGPPVTVRLPAGFRVVGPVQVARDVLYANATPAFKLITSPTAAVLAGTAPPKLPPARIVADAQLLALDRSVGLAEISLLGFPWVAVTLSRPSATTVRATIGLSRIPQVNAVELRFPAGLKVVRVARPTGTDALPTGSAVRLIASGGFFDEGVPYQFDVMLSAPPKRGDFVAVRASTHYFESSLPFTERFPLP
jgi:hypothetical protein